MTTARMALLADQRNRWLNGQTIGVEYYLIRDPTIIQDSDLILDLIAQEALLDHRPGRDARVQALIERFPRLAAPIRDQFAVERILVGFLEPEWD